MARYQVYVHFGVAQGASPTVTRYHSTLNLAHRLLCYQVDGKVLIHLEKDREEKLVQTSTHTGRARGIYINVDHPHIHAHPASKGTFCAVSFKYYQCRSSKYTSNEIHVHTPLTFHLDIISNLQKSSKNYNSTKNSPLSLPEFTLLTARLTCSVTCSLLALPHPPSHTCTRTHMRTHALLLYLREKTRSSS